MALRWKYFVLWSPSLSQVIRDLWSHIISSRYKISSNSRFTSNIWSLFWTGSFHSSLSIPFRSSTMRFVTLPKFSLLHFCNSFATVSKALRGRQDHSPDFYVATLSLSPSAGRFLSPTWSHIWTVSSVMAHLRNDPGAVGGLCGLNL